MRAKRVFLSLLSIFFITEANAQVQYLPPTVHRLTLSLGGGVTTLFGDVPYAKPFNPAGRLNLDYNITPFIAVGVEGQYGRLSEGEKEKMVEGNKALFMENTYYTGNVNARVSIGQFNRYTSTELGRFLNNIYLGTGLGYLRATNENLTTVFPESGKPIDYIEYEAEEWIVPINLGINLDIPGILGERTITANVNYQFNQALGESLDGYNFNRYIHKVSQRDAFGFLSVAVRFHFGGIK
jgi:hypothetical protein